MRCRSLRVSLEKKRKRKKELILEEKKVCLLPFAGARIVSCIFHASSQREELKCKISLDRLNIRALSHVSLITEDEEGQKDLHGRYLSSTNLPRG